jgi:capsid protein
MIKPIARFIASKVFGINNGFDSAIRSNSGSIPWIDNRDASQDLTEWTRDEIMRKTRYMERNDGVTREIAQSMKLYSVGDGIRPQAKTQDKEWNKQAVEYFSEWASRPDITGRFTLAECQSMICNAMEFDGEIFTVKTRDEAGNPKIQLLESHRIGNTNKGSTETDDGIIFDNIGRAISYRIKLSDTEYIDVSANSILHIYDPERPSQNRSTTRLQHSLIDLINRKELCKIELDAAREDGKVIRTIQNEAGELVEGRDYDFGISAPAVSNEGNIVQRVKQFKDNLGVYVAALAKDEKYTSYSSTRPRSNFAPYVEFLNRMALAGILPYEFALDSSKIGGAGVRLIVAKSDRIFSWRQNILISRFLTPTWGYVIGDAIDRNILPDIDNWHKASWVTPKRITVDAGREAAQHRADIQAGLGTLHDHYEESGMDFYEETERRVTEFEYILKRAQETGIPMQYLFNIPNTPQPTDEDLDEKDAKEKREQPKPASMKEDDAL